MAVNNNLLLTVVEPLYFHRTCGKQVRLTENNTLAIRERLNDALLFTNRPILPNEIVQLLIEEISNEFFGLIRVGFTTIDPGSWTHNTLPQGMPPDDSREWFIPTINKPPTIKKNAVIRMKYTAEGEICLDYEGSNTIKYSAQAPFMQDIWAVIDLNGCVSRIRLIQNQEHAINDLATRAQRRYQNYTNNGRQENVSTYYSGGLANGITHMNDCDEHSELSFGIAVRKNTRSSVIVDENLKRNMCIVMQILDMDHTYPPYFTIRCLTDDRASDEHTQLIDANFGHMTLGDEIGIRVMPDGTITISCNNRHVKPLFEIDLTVNDNLQMVRGTKYNIEFIMDRRVTGLRLVGLYRPTETEARAAPQVIGGGCLATVREKVCPNAPSALLFPCKHLCVCFDCAQLLVNRHSCPNRSCRKRVDKCIKVFKN